MCEYNLKMVKMFHWTTLLHMYTRIMVSKGTWHKTSTQNLRFFWLFWVLVTLIFFGNPVLALRDHTLTEHNLKIWVLTWKNTLKTTGKWILAYPYFFGNPVLALRDHTLRDHNACTFICRNGGAQPPPTWDTFSPFLRRCCRTGSGGTPLTLRSTPT